MQIVKGKELDTHKLDELGNRLSLEVESGVESREVRGDRWRLLRRMYYNEESNEYQPYEGAYTGCYNLVQPALDKLNASVVDVLLSKSPYMVPQVFTNEDAEDKLERVLQFFMEKDDLRTALKQVGPVAAWSNVGQVIPEWDAKKLGFTFKVLEPFSTSVYPAWVHTLDEAKSYGHCFYRRYGQIRKLQDDGHYLAGSLVKSSERKDATSSTQSNAAADSPLRSSAVRHDDELVELWDLFYEEEPGEWYRCILAKESQTILKREPWPYRDSDGEASQRVAEFGFKPRSVMDGYYPKMSVACDLQQLQYDVNEISATYMNGMRFNAYGAFFANGGLDTGKALIKAEPGGVYQCDTEGMQIFNPKVDVSGLLSALEYYSRKADEVTRVSQMAVGVADSRVSTATEAGLVAGGQQRSIDEYIQTFGAGVRQVYEYVQAVLFAHWNEWFPVYGAHLELEPQDRELFNSHALWRLSVSTVGSTPQAQMAMAIQMYQMSMQPGSSYETYELETRIAQFAERQGFTNAEGVQRPEDLAALVAYVAEKTGLEPESVARGIQAAALSEQQSLGNAVGELEGQPMLDGDPTGTLSEATDLSGFTGNGFPG